MTTAAPEHPTRRAFFSKLAERFPADHTQHPLPLVHYTNAEGVLGMLCERELWATHTDFLNDATELQHGFEIASKALQAKQGQLYHLTCRPEPGRNNQHLEFTQKLISAANESLSKLKCKVEYYVTCFCDTADLLSQWRAYGGASGYAVFFDRNRLNSLCSGSCDGPALLHPVTYGGDTDVKSIIDAAVEVITETLMPGPAQPPNDWPEVITGTLAEELIDRCPLIKNPSFREEREWRLRIKRNGLAPTVDPVVKFRSRNGMLVPYVAMKLPDDRKAGLETLIASVALGPTAPTYPLRKALQLMGYSFLQVGRSGVPLR